jgi:hypothetical protein
MHISWDFVVNSSETSVIMYLGSNSDVYFPAEIESIEIMSSQYFDSEFRF